METDHKHRFDGKEDRNYYQKPFDDNTDRLPQIDEESARLAERRPNTAAFGDPDGAGKGQATDVNASQADGGSPSSITDAARLSQFPDGNDEA